MADKRESVITKKEITLRHNLPKEYKTPEQPSVGGSSCYALSAKVSHAFKVKLIRYARSHNRSISSVLISRFYEVALSGSEIKKERDYERYDFDLVLAYQSFSVEPRVYEAISTRARQEGCTRSQYVRKLLFPLIRDFRG